MTTINPAPESERDSEAFKVPVQRLAGAARIVRPLNIGYKTIQDFVDLPLSLDRPAASGFCQAMQVEVSGEIDTASWKTQRRKWHDFPWVTPIIGSGTVGLPDAFWAKARRLDSLVIATLEKSAYVPTRAADGTAPAPITVEFQDSPETIISSFLKSLRTERVGGRELPPATATTDQPVEEFVAGLVLAAAQLTRVFHKMCLRTGQPLARWATDRVTADREPELDVEVRPLLAALDFAQQRVGRASTAQALGEPFQRAVETLLTGISSDLRRERYLLRVEPLRQLTDLAWQCVVWDTCGSAYPGWTELLLDLVLLQESRRAPAQRRPRWHALNDLSIQIADLIRPASLAAWEESRIARRTGAVNPAREFYDETARLLWRQTAAAGRVRNVHASGGATKVRLSAGALPHSVAFVTSFDLELEMALARTRPADQQFISVVMPVYLWWQDTDEGEFFWLEGVIKLPDADASSEQVMRALTQPVQWRAMYEGRYDLPDHPVVVRLTGSPLADLNGAHEAARRFDGVEGGHADEESLSADLRKLDLRWDLRSEFVHAATVDEYLALRQAEAEYFWVYSRSTFANMHNRALPKALLACREPGPVRFWLVVGVPFKDPAVRLRVLSQMSSRRFMLLGEGEVDGNRRHIGRGVRAAGHDIAGLAINWRLDDEEAILLISLGLQVITDGQAEDLNPHLRHHSLHLEAFAAGEASRANRRSCSRTNRAEAEIDDHNR